MRSLILVVVTAFVLLMGALVYFWMMVPHKRASSARQASISTRPGMRSTFNELDISPGDNPAVKKFDPSTGELISEFMSEEYTPRRGGLIDVKNATARFYMKNGQIVELHGKTGTFHTDVPPEGKHKAISEPRASAPSRGQLKDVTVTILDLVDKAHETRQPSMVIAMNNAAFDSENATIVTEAFTDPVTHQVVPWDQVPVTVRSPDTNPNGYDFDGRGLKMNWNERDHRLTSLDVIHGERLIIKNPKNVSQPKAITPPEKTMAQTRADEGLRSTEMASLDLMPALVVAQATETPAPVHHRPHPIPTTEGATPATEPVARRGSRVRRPYVAPAPQVPKLPTSLEPPIYRAEFHENVRIVQNDQTLATADRMFVDFWMQSGDDPDAATQPAASTQPEHHLHAATQPATTQVAVTQPASRPAPATQMAASQPTSRPASEAPIYIYWTGPLHVAPHAEVALSPKMSIITLEGDPVHARPPVAEGEKQNSEILSSRLIYHTEDGSMKATALPNTDVKLTSADVHGESIIHTTSLDYFTNANPPTAILSGPSTADLPGQSPGETMHVTWTQRCALRFERSEDNDNAIKEADLTGNVHVNHPQIHLDSERLLLEFATSTTQPTRKKGESATTKSSSVASAPLKQLVASGSVHCVMTDNDNKKQTIDGDRLTLLTDRGPDGELIPRTMNADGKVHAVSEEQDLHANQLAAVLVPTTRPKTTKTPATTQSKPGSNAELQSLIAQGAVHVISLKDNSEAFSDTMLVDKSTGKQNVKFVGGDPGAKIIDKNNTVIGPIITIAAEDQILVVDGAGEMEGTQQEHPGEAAKPMHVTWTRNMRIDGKQNIVTALGNVKAKTTEADGTVRTVTGDRAQLLLVDAPTTQPSTKPATKPATQVATTHPTSKPTDDSEPMAHKQVRQAIFYDNAVVNSLLSDPAGLPVQRMNLWAPMVQYDVLGMQISGQEPLKRITVPVPGTMLVEDYRAPTTQPAPADSATGGMSAQGATSFKWQKSLIYDEGTHRATMDGDVIIDHRDRDELDKENSMHVTGDRVIAFIEPAPPEAKTATSGPSTKPAATQPQVHNVIVQDHVRVTMKSGELTAKWIEYSPVTRIMIAHGTPEQDVVFTQAVVAPTATQPAKGFAAGGAQPIHAQEMEWDAGADLPKVIHGNATFRR